MKPDENLFQALERIFHEPNRLAIMSALCAADNGLTFVELKMICDLTDGNLNRHLNVLKESKAIRVKKAFVDDKPRTTVFITKEGLDRFSEYLGALASVIEQARDALPAKSKPSVVPAFGKTATA
ncbi:MAG: transcriptional regulator [Kiritimatiellales bacterium]|nr:transcriptional regulator [Kiritimatiellales bacterium]